MRGNHTVMFLSLSFSLPPLLSKNKYIKSLKKEKPAKRSVNAGVDIMKPIYNMAEVYKKIKTLYVIPVEPLRKYL